MTRPTWLWLLCVVALSLGACDRGTNDAAPPTAVPAPPSASARPGPTANPGLARGSVAVGMHRVAVELARSTGEQRQGLSDRRRLAEGTGMLFPYATPSQPGFWMKDMHFDIDIVWIAGGRVVGIEHRVSHDVVPPLPVYRPPVPIDAALEVPAGTAERLGWRAGDPVTIDTSEG